MPETSYEFKQCEASEMFEVIRVRGNQRESIGTADIEQQCFTPAIRHTVFIYASLMRELIKFFEAHTSTLSADCQESESPEGFIPDLPADKDFDELADDIDDSVPEQRCSICGGQLSLGYCYHCDRP